MFSVRSAYRIALAEVSDSGMGSSSCDPNGDRKLWNIIWEVNVPTKIRVFAWRLATNSLAVQEERSRRIKKTMPVCTVCGCGSESAYHAVMVCPKALGLGQRMRQDGNLPDEAKLRYSGRDWVLVLLDSVNKLTRQHLLFLWWRAWHLRNDSVFSTGKCTIEASVVFIRNYSLAMENGKEEDATRLHCLREMGECTVDTTSVPSENNNSGSALGRSRQGDDNDQLWKLPAQGWLKLNTDASFLEATGEAWWGAALRSEEGRIVTATWGHCPTCASVEEAEVTACVESLHILALDSGTKIHLEVDCQVIIARLERATKDRSYLCFQYRELHQVMSNFAESNWSWTSRTGNGLAHSLAKFARESKTDGGA